MLHIIRDNCKKAYFGICVYMIPGYDIIWKWFYSDLFVFPIFRSIQT